MKRRQFIAATGCISLAGCVESVNDVVNDESEEDTVEMFEPALVEVLEVTVTDVRRTNQYTRIYRDRDRENSIQEAAFGSDFLFVKLSIRNVDRNSSFISPINRRVLLLKYDGEESEPFTSNFSLPDDDNVYEQLSTGREGLDFDERAEGWVRFLIDDTIETNEAVIEVFPGFDGETKAFELEETA